MEKARRKRATRKRVGGPHATTRGPKFTRQRARHLHARAHAHTLFRATYTERKGVVPSLTCRRLEGERTIAGAERTRQLRSMMFFLGFWNSLTPLRPPFLPSPFDYHFVTLPLSFSPVCLFSLFASPFLSPRFARISSSFEIIFSNSGLFFYRYCFVVFSRRMARFKRLSCDSS